MKGTRVQAIIRELRGEKIDIVEWSEDPVQFVTNAISPAKVQRVSIVDEAERVMEVIVEDKQLSLAIGKKGQNVRLAAKLTGWKIDIKSEEEKRREVEAQFAGLEAAGGFALPGIEPSIIATLLQAGYDSPAKVADAEIADLSVLSGMDQDKAERTIAAARLTAVTGVSSEENAPAAPEPTPPTDEVAEGNEDVPAEAEVKE
jgi:N utilization substance protein A